MLWFDWMTLGIVLVVAVVETIRARNSGGFGQALFDALGLVIAALGSTWLAGPIADTLGAAKWVITLVAFAILAVGALAGARTVFSAFEWSSDSFDGGLSFLFGVACGWVIANMVLRIIVLKQGDIGEVAMMMPNAPVAREVFQFRTWNILMNRFFKLNLGPRIDLDVG
ncbi:MAG TPA: hypothetical protein ENN51_09275 [candidate division WOR-3 bacterium]|uniref:CvpA family protein n=1 Tax=candidate division WOR-3 bacterium TaxID=2052148 RepID=A0A7V0T7V4_UNCW3|nr:hypothetical protein [candidate division WOR-3 bacterium]